MFNVTFSIEYASSR